ncbi:hypothetical protein ACRALDRAFT_1060311 [Sodiomyces alcalophilus JCM 7366]|uniref:uncharacterized protein n=1 Tax=Sodiomyces alcalophilus JCM 7366 TaxID=591952 RepID=UPI0039B6E646
MWHCCLVPGQGLWLNRPLSRGVFGGAWKLGNRSQGARKDTVSRKVVLPRSPYWTGGALCSTDKTGRGRRLEI